MMRRPLLPTFLSMMEEPSPTSLPPGRAEIMTPMDASSGAFYKKYLTGSRVIVRNVPGAGHIVGTNTLYASRPDGLTIGTFNTGLIYTQLLKREGAQFDLAQVDWIGSAAHDVRVIILPTDSPYGTFEDYINSGDTLLVAAAGVGSAAYNDTRIVAEALHLNVEIIPGFEGNEGADEHDAR